ncbi:unnamed protein product [Linum trigynum]|uniref:Uncharacterized protein n=1 Tax=Linum trigynum TaxID=586398 RepID=A0AAV2CTK8_9ROSI
MAEVMLPYDHAKKNLLLNENELQNGRRLYWMKRKQYQLRRRRHLEWKGPMGKLQNMKGNYYGPPREY